MGVFNCYFEVFTVFLLFSSCSFGNKLDILHRKIQGLELSLYQDIRLLQGSVEQNTNEIAKIAALINETFYHMGNLGNTLGESRSSKTTHTDTAGVQDGDDQKSGIGEITEEIERVKRAFYDEKIYLRNIQTEITDKLNSVLSFLNGITEKMEISNQKSVDLEKKISDNMDMQARIETKLDDLKQQTVATKDEILANVDLKLEAAADEYKSDNLIIVSTLREGLRNDSEILKSLITLDDVRNISMGQAVTLVLHEQENEFGAKMVCDALALDSSDCTTSECCVEAIVNILRVFNIPSVIYWGGNLRLVNASRTMRGIGGRLEANNNNEWGTICDDHFDNKDANVACSYLGFPSGTYKAEAYFGQGNGTIWLDDVQCAGDENSIFNCPRDNARGIGEHNCGHAEDVGIICS